MAQDGHEVMGYKQHEMPERGLPRPSDEQITRCQSITVNASAAFFCKCLSFPFIAGAI
jgi:hypothetical protein